ncbi:MAG: hypothetical protein R3E90_15080 [Marinicella sp.]|nr:hypothetical protein [Xanthomonadales bacterium]
MKNTHLTTTINILMLLTFSVTAFSQNKTSDLLPEANRDYGFDYSTTEPVAFNSFAQAAEWADVVAIAQIVNIDYLKTRELNSQGQAFLKVRVPYKGVQKNDLMIVSAKGFEDHVCYYPDREGEGQRYLLFLKNSKNQGEYHGFKPYCQLQVLLTDTGEYALRYPMDTTLNIEPELITDINFNDPHAVIDATEWTGLSRDEHQKKYQTKLSEDSDMFQKYYYLTYTKGIMMHHIRKLMNLKPQARISSKQM